MRAHEIWLAAAALSVAFGALAEPAKDSQRVVTGEVRFLAKITGGSFTAHSEELTGALRLNREEGTLSGKLQVPADSFRTGLALRDRHMRDRYLEAKTHKAIALTVETQPITLQAGASSQLQGLLNVRGVSRPIEVEIRIDEVTEAGFKATTAFPVDITDFGIPQPSFAVVKMEPIVQATVELVVRRAE